jgi:hypothetical protein
VWAWSLPSATLAHGADTYGVGGGKGDLFGGAFLFTFNLSAHDSGPQGDFGHVGGTLTDSAGNKFSYRMDVDCVAIPSLFGGDSASISGIVKKASGTTTFFDIAPGDRLLVGVVDGGNPKDRPVDSFVFTKTKSPDCEQTGISIFPPNVTQGNVVIKQ